MQLLSFYLYINENELINMQLYYLIITIRTVSTVSPACNVQ